ncbi:hypothetical protein DPMN_104051 [Dreissena polymorpha]|uniref:Uncharacterized protein n=1 Tax=Dreissena polymorpha TaxID=45954 RepID=A0A9D4H912_DREPO|nr:hypothetical protein DPMN_104051 [Dreissena polymorpha]
MRRLRRNNQNISYRLTHRRIPPESSERGEDERLTRTDTHITTKLVHRTLTG